MRNDHVRYLFLTRARRRNEPEDPSSDPWTPKYKELYDLAKEAFAEEIARLTRIDAKASNYLSLVTLLAGSFGFFSQYALQRCLPITCPSDFLLVVFLVLLGASLLTSWYLTFRVLRFQTYHKIPVEPIFFKENKLATIYYSMAITIKEGMLENRRKGNKKAARIRSVYWLIMIHVIFIVCTATIYAIHVFNEPTIEKCICCK